jgi:hypothetical protein
MITNNRLAAIAIGFAVLAVSVNASAANRKARAHHRHYVTKSIGCSVYRNAEGELVNCRGWRKRDNLAGWDNTCFNLPHLSSQFACSTGGGQGN